MILPYLLAASLSASPAEKIENGYIVTEDGIGRIQTVLDDAVQVMFRKTKDNTFYKEVKGDGQVLSRRPEDVFDESKDCFYALFFGTSPGETRNDILYRGRDKPIITGEEIKKYLPFSAKLCDENESK